MRGPNDSFTIHRRSVSSMCKCKRIGEEESAGVGGEASPCQRSIRPNPTRTAMDLASALVNLNNMGVRPQKCSRFKGKPVFRGNTLRASYKTQASRLVDFSLHTDTSSKNDQDAMITTHFPPICCLALTQSRIPSQASCVVASAKPPPRGA